MADKLMNGFRALDLTDDKGFVCGKILATLGVDVIKIEKPGGDSARNIPPFFHGSPDLEKSLYWFAFNSDKKSITLNLESKRGKELFLKLVEKADFVLESFMPGYLDKIGLGYEILNKVNPRIIMTSITPFGQKGPYSQYKGCELVASAMGGILENIGEPDRPPVKEALDSVYFQAGADAALGTMMAHYYCQSTGEGQPVDVSIQECATSRNTDNILIWQFDQRLVKRNGPISMLGTMHSRWIWPCKDGYLYWYLMGGQFGSTTNQAVSNWIDDDGVENPLKQVTNWNDLDRGSLSQEMNDVFEEAIGKFFLRRTSKEIENEGRRRGINACVINNPSEVLQNPQLLARKFWKEVEHPELGTTITYPEHFFLCSETENYMTHRAPLIGENNDVIYGELGVSEGEIAELKKAGII